MSKTRVLLIPSFLGMPSHFIPLVKLYQRMNPAKYEAAFFVPLMTPEIVQRSGMKRYLPRADFYYCGDFYSRFDIPIFPGSREYTVASELEAYSTFKPDVIVDDCNLTTALTHQLVRTPRITILRTGAFAGAEPFDRNFAHTLEPMTGTVRVPPGSGLVKPASIGGFFQADAYIVPGIDTLERTHPHADGRARTFFCGPLVLDAREEEIFHPPLLGQFFQANEGRRLAYVTLGFSPRSADSPRLIACLRHLIDVGFAVLTNAPVSSPEGAALLAAADHRILVSDTFPMHQVAERADLIVHVGGSGMYHYPLLHLKPSITVGTQTYDREEILLRMASQGLCLHLPSPAQTDAFVGLFEQAVRRLLDAEFPFDAGLTARLRSCRESITRVANEFDIDQVVTAALSRTPPKS